MRPRTVVILGGSGFVGTTLANKLYEHGYQLRVLTRNREARRMDMLPIPSLDLIEADIHDEAQLNLHLQGCHAVINLVGILNERGSNGKGFARAHVELAEKVIRACRHNGIRRLLHMSALNADAVNGSSHYLKTKGRAEDLVHAAESMHVTSFRPSVIFGPGDSFFNRFADLLKLSPLVFPLACAGARFAPVYVEDVAEAFVVTLEEPDSYGQRYEMCGPREYTLLELVRFTARACNRNRIILPLPDFISRLQGMMFDLFGFIFYVTGIEQPFSTDNYLSTRLPSVTDNNSLPALGIRPTHLEGVVSRYLSGHSKRHAYYRFRQHARR